MNEKKKDERKKKKKVSIAFLKDEKFIFILEEKRKFNIINILSYQASRSLFSLTIVVISHL